MAKLWNKYANTTARAHGKPGKTVRPKSTTIDAHAHILIPQATPIARPYLDAHPSPLARFANAQTTALNYQQEQDTFPRISTIEKRLQDMDEMGVDIQLMLPAPPQCWYTVPLEIGIKAARTINDGIAEICASKPDRLIPMGTVPMQNGQAAAEELERCMKKLKFKGVQVLTNVNGRELSDPTLEPFWAKAEETGALIVLHPNGFTHGERLTRHYFSNVIGNPLDTTLALHFLIFDGVLERYPKLKILAVHGGGYLGGYSGRIDHAWGARSDTHGVLPRAPTSYLKQVYVDTVVFTPHQLRHLVEVFGADHVLLGTDWPFDMMEYDPVGHVVASGFDAKATEAICGGNVKKLIGI